MLPARVRGRLVCCFFSFFSFLLLDCPLSTLPVPAQTSPMLKGKPRSGQHAKSYTMPLGVGVGVAKLLCKGYQQGEGMKARLEQMYPRWSPTCHLTVGPQTHVSGGSR